MVGVNCPCTMVRIWFLTCAILPQLCTFSLCVSGEIASYWFSLSGIVTIWRGFHFCVSPLSFYLEGDRLWPACPCCAACFHHATWPGEGCNWWDIRPNRIAEFCVLLLLGAITIRCGLIAVWGNGMVSGFPSCY